jgi:hypothetical protein
MRNERGFIFPTTMVIVLFCLLIVAHISMSLISEKQFYSETSQYYLLDNLMQLAVDQSLFEINNGTAKINEATVSNTINGTFTYVISEITPSIYEVQISCKSTKNKQYTASYQYDLLKSEMNVWSEY